jgi:hypothetical protein
MAQAKQQPKTPILATKLLAHRTSLLFSISAMMVSSKWIKSLLSPQNKGDLSMI